MLIFPYLPSNDGFYSLNNYLLLFLLFCYFRLVMKSWRHRYLWRRKKQGINYLHCSSIDTGHKYQLSDNQRNDKIQSNLRLYGFQVPWKQTNKHFQFVLMAFCLNFHPLLLALVCCQYIMNYSSVRLVLYMCCRMCRCSLSNKWSNKQI